MQIFVDLPGFQPPSTIIGEEYRPDLLLTTSDKCRVSYQRFFPNLVLICYEPNQHTHTQHCLDPTLLLFTSHVYNLSAMTKFLRLHLALVSHYFNHHGRTLHIKRRALIMFYFIIHTIIRYTYILEFPGSRACHIY